MAISQDDIEHVAKLARLKITEEEKPLYQEQLDSIVGYVDKLQELKTDKVPEMQTAGTTSNVFRQDDPRPSNQETRERIIENFPRKQGVMLEVQQVFADQDE